MLKGSNVLVLFQEVPNLAVSARFPVVNTTCHHSSGHQKEIAGTSRLHYFPVFMLQNMISALQQRTEVPSEDT